MNRIQIKFFAVMLTAAAFMFAGSFAHAGNVPLASGAPVNLAADASLQACSVNVSKNVKGAYFGAATGYALATFHINGKKEYGTGSTSGGIYFRNCNDPACGPDWATLVNDSTFDPADYNNNAL